MEPRLSKKEYYYRTTPKKNKGVIILWVIAIVWNVIGLALGMASLLGLIVCIVCGFVVKATFDKWIGVGLAIWGVVQWGLIYVLGGTAPWATIILGIDLYSVLNNLDKAYANYLQTGMLPDTTGY